MLAAGDPMLEGLGSADPGENPVFVGGSGLAEPSFHGCTNKGFLYIYQFGTLCKVLSCVHFSYVS